MFKNMKRINKFFVLELITCILLLISPYYLFEGKLFIGGDDTRLQYLYPEIFLKHIAPYSWNRFASVGTSITSQFYLPFLVIWSILESIINNKIILSYFLRYLKTAEFKNIFKALIASTFFSLVALSVPWILGLFLPLFISLIILPILFTKKKII